MGEENKVTLHGMWASTCSKRVELALKIKGIPYDYVEEELSNKSPLLLKLLPDDPYERAKVRFWASYLQQLLDSIGKAITSDEEARERTLKEVFEKLNVVEKGMKDFFPGGSPIIRSENMGLYDILIVAIFGPYRAQEEVLGVKILDPERNLLLLSWVTALNELPVVKEGTPPREKLVTSSVHHTKQHQTYSTMTEVLVSSSPQCFLFV
ncbi:hypothetical protein F0562_023441 [Nyssa sinensis]|uniref:Glutathione S-transferase n=1 Tax=Nyssa sinensis TaxID=561372 RepID=A0A5J5BGV6_9ASTE|nr:hypothetical protein F0562_023441 [Nyssa sinensis]